jgi:hypothetical protein
MSSMKRLPAALFSTALVLAAGVSLARQDGSPQGLTQSVPQFTFRAQGRNPALIFLRQGEVQEGVPRVYFTGRDGWQVAEFAEGLRKASWVAVGRANADAWAVAEEADSGYLVILASNNSGRSWRQRGALRKVSKQGTLEYFGMNRDGKGSLIVELTAEDAGADAPRLGHYLYLTENGGKSWAEPIFAQSRPGGPISDLTAPDETFPQDAKPDAATWQRLLTSLRPAG